MRETSGHNYDIQHTPCRPVAKVKVRTELVLLSQVEHAGLISLASRKLPLRTRCDCCSVYVVRAHGLAPSRRKVDLSSLKRSGREAAGGRGCAGGRRVLPDGRGGFTIATSVGGAGPRASQQQQAQRGANSKRPRGVGAGAGRIETTQAAAAAAAVAAIPGVYRGVGYSVNGKKNGRKGGGVAGVRGKKGPSQQQQQQEEGRVNVGAKTKGLSNGGAGGGRSLEELMSGGLAAVRR